jgi:trimeric autotransporter adhesin
LRKKDSEALKGKMLQTGFIAQEVEVAAKSVGFDFSGVDAPKNENDFYGLRYAEFVVPLVKAVQEQQLRFKIKN